MLVKSNSITCLLVCLVFGATSVKADSVVLVEAEAFEDKGGWVVDPQFMDQMGSPYLLAHGLGHPVADATTTVTFPETGQYKVWVRTFDWVAPWKTPETPETKRTYGTPGVFELLVDGKKLDATFGTTTKWDWQDGGTIEISRKEVEVALRDLAGFKGRTNMWNVKETDAPVAFPRCPWALDLTDKPFPGRWHIGDQFHYRDRSGVPGAERSLGCWSWESGFYHDPVEKSEYIRDWNFRAAYGAWDALKNVDKVYPNHTIDWMGYISGKRESRRLLGPVVVTGTALRQKHVWVDGCVVMSRGIDLHDPHSRFNEGFEGDAFISHADIARYPAPAWLPYRMLYSRNTDNLFMAGRCVSVDQEGLGAARVMRTCGLMGEVVGLAATLCKEKGCDPNDVYEKHLEPFKQLLIRGANPGGGMPVADATGEIEVLAPGKGRRVAGVDDTYNIDQLPDALAGLPSVVIPRGDLNWMAPGFKFQISGPADIYLAVHDRGGYKPPADWKETDLKLTWMKNQTDTVYVKSCKAGVVAVPGHDGRSGHYYGLPHRVFVKGTGVTISPVDE